jgi:hypothetical protein
MSIKRTTVVQIGLAVLLACCVAEIVIRLIQAGEDSLGFVVTAVSLVPALLAPQSKAFEESLPKLFANPLAVILVQALLLFVLILGRQVIFQSIAMQRLAEARTITDPVTAQTSLLQAMVLGSDVPAWLANEVREDLQSPLGNEKALPAALLYVGFKETNSEVDLRLRRAVLEDTCDGLAQQHSDSSERNVSILTVVDKDVALRLMITLDNMAAMIVNKLLNNDIQLDPIDVAFSSICPGYSLQHPITMQTAAIYLETLRIVDQAFPSARSRSEQSVSLSNLGVALEQFSEQPDYLDKSAAAYREAITLDPTNFIARHSLSSLLLVTIDVLPEKEQALYTAISVAFTGWQMLWDDPSAPCMSTTPNAYPRSRYCFQLLTDDAGARLERMTRGITSTSDSKSYINLLLRRAITIAEQNNQFSAYHIYSAEPYYYFALLDETNQTPNILCTIIDHTDQLNPRHRKWADFASARLGDKSCP